MRRSTKLWIVLGTALIVGQILYVVGIQFWFKPYVVTTSEGMEPGLQVSDYAFVRVTKNIARGDVIAYTRSGYHSAYLKRAMALGGDTIELRDRRLYLNGNEIVEPYVLRDDKPVPDFGYFRVPANHVFALGDNRAEAEDSRAQGSIAMGSVIGRVVYVFSFVNGPRRLARVPPRSAPARPRG